MLNINDAQQNIAVNQVNIPYGSGVGPIVINQSGDVSPIVQADFTALTAYTTPSWLSFSRTGNAMVTDSTGKLTYAPNNLVLRSQEFDNSAWFKVAGGTASAPVVTANAATAPDGTVTAESIVFALNGGTTISDSSTISQVVSSPGTFIHSVWLRSDTPCTLMLRNPANNGVVSNINVTTSWTRFSTIGTAPTSTNMLFGLRGASSTSDATTVFAWGAQIEQVTYQTTPSTYVATTSAAYYGPRYDFDASTTPATPRGLLIEESRANLLTYSEQFDNAAWSKLNATITANSTTAPDGTSSADTFVLDAGTNEKVVYETATQAAPVALSVYLKAGSGVRYVQLDVSSVTGSYANFDIISGTVGTVGATATATITSVGNGWYRCSIAMTAGGNVRYIRAVPASNSGRGAYFVAVGGENFYLWGAQLEAGSFATSYIPTTSASVTRAADVAQLTGSALTTLQGTNASAIVETGIVANAWPAYTLSGQSNNNIYFRAASGTTLRSTFNSVNLDVTIGSSGNFYTGAVRAAIGFSAAGRSLVANNGTVGTDANAQTAPTGVNLGQLPGGSYTINGVVRSAAIYNQRLPDAILKKKSAVGAPY